MKNIGMNMRGYGLLLLIAGVYTVIYYFVPLQLDDWTFMAEWRNVGGEEGFSLTKLYNYWQVIREGDNGRIANTLSPFSTVISPWHQIFPLLTGIASAMVVAMTGVLAFGRKDGKRLLPLLLSWAAIIYLLPWRDCIFVKDFSLNYVWGAFITLAFILYMLTAIRNGWTPLKFIVLVLLAIVAGGWHEGFAATTVCGLLLLTGVRGFKLPWQWWAVGTIYVASMLFFFISPGMFARMGKDAGVIRAEYSVVKMCADFFPVILLLFLMAGAMCVKRGRDLLRRCLRFPVFIVSAGVVASGVIISFYFNHSPRSAFWPDLCAVIMILSIARGFVERVMATNANGYISLLMICVCAVPMGFTMVWQRAFYLEAREIMTQMTQSATGTVYRDVIPTSAVPNYTLRMPTRSHWVTPFHYKCIREYTGISYPAVVPPELQYEGYSAGRPLGGNARAVRVGDAILLPPDYPADISVISAEGGASGKERVGFIGVALPYINELGERNVYFIPYGIDSGDIEYLDLE